MEGVPALFCGICVWGVGGGGLVKSPDCQLLCAESCSWSRE